MTEANMQTMFGKHLLVNPPDKTEVYELKFCKGTSLPFGDVKEHQIEALLRAENAGIYHKITDQPWIQNRAAFTYKKPFDCFYVKEALAYVVVWFYRPRTKKIFIKIPIQAWLHEQNTCKRKSITLVRALEIGISFDLV